MWVGQKLGTEQLKTTFDRFFIINNVAEGAILAKTLGFTMCVYVDEARGVLVFGEELRYFESQSVKHLELAHRR